MKFVQHIPGFATYDPLTDARERADITTLEELQQINCVKNFMGSKNFSKLSRGDVRTKHNAEENRPLEDTYCAHVMAELDDGHEWWVVGSLLGTMEEIMSLGLPEWVAKEREPQPNPTTTLDPGPAPTVDQMVSSGALSFVTRDILPALKEEHGPTPIKKLYPTAGELWSNGGVDLLTVLKVEGGVIEFTQRSGSDGRLDVKQRESATLEKFKELLADKELGTPNEYTVDYLHESGD